MLEHAHRDDPVERAVERAIVDLFEPHPIRNPCFLCPPPCDRELFVGERDAEHIDIGNTVQIERHTAPAAADVEHTLARLEQQLGGDMGLLVRLRLFKRFVRSEEHTSELQSLMRISYAVFCLKKKTD